MSVGAARPGTAVIRPFRDRGTEDVFNGLDPKAARKRCSQNLFRTAGNKLDRRDDAQQLGDLRVPPENRLEALKGDRNGQHSIRINDQYRFCFIWHDDGSATDVEIVDYHD